MSIFRISVIFQAPTDFVFTWCNDFRTDDPDLTGGGFQRKVSVRNPHRAIFEDLEETRAGWSWNRSVVTLDPPSAWNVERTGNHQDIRGTYRLRALTGNRTKLEMRFTVRRKVRGAWALIDGPREVDQYWDKLVPILERDYRRGAGMPPHRTRRRSVR